MKEDEIVMALTISTSGSCQAASLVLLSYCYYYVNDVDVDDDERIDESSRLCAQKAFHVYHAQFDVTKG